MWFDQGIIAVRPATPDDCEAVLAAVGIGAAQLHPYVRMVIASPGTPRLLVPVADRDMLAALTPDFAALGSATRERGLLGCFAYVPPGRDRPAVARMFAPAIGVDEDVANANSTGCLAAHLRPDGPIDVEQGDALDRPATVSAYDPQWTDMGRRPRRDPWVGPRLTAGGLSDRVSGTVEADVDAELARLERDHGRRTR